MEAESQDDTTVPQPTGTPSPTKSPVRGCIWLFLLVMVLITGAYFAWNRYAKPMEDFKIECKNMIETNPAIQEELGEPLKVGEPVQEAVKQQITLRYPVIGSQGKGTAVFEATVGDDWVPKLDNTFLLLEDGTELSVDPDEATTLDIEGLEDL